MLDGVPKKQQKTTCLFIIVTVWHQLQTGGASASVRQQSKGLSSLATLAHTENLKWGAKQQQPQVHKQQTPSKTAAPLINRSLLIGADERIMYPGGSWVSRLLHSKSKELCYCGLSSRIMLSPLKRANVSTFPYPEINVGRGWTHIGCTCGWKRPL